jgi:hypothetical protein
MQLDALVLARTDLVSRTIFPKIITKATARTLAKPTDENKTLKCLTMNDLPVMYNTMKILSVKIVIKVEKAFVPPHY